VRIIITILLMIAAFWSANYAIKHSVDVVIQWGKLGSISLTSTSLFIALIVAFVCIYFLIALFRFLFGLSKRIRQYRQKRLSAQAQKELTKGLIHFTEGHWQQAEKTLTNNIAYSETPLLKQLRALPICKKPTSAEIFI